MRMVLVLVLTWCATQSTVSQVRTEETRTTVDSTSGDTTYTRSVIISESEDITPLHSVITINPLKFILFYNISYYHAVSPAVVIGGGIQAPTPTDVSGFGVGAEVRIHPSGKAPRGFYIAPNLAYNSLESGSIKTDPLVIGVLLGWQWFPGDEFAMGLGIGVDYYIGDVDVEGNLSNYDGAAPALRFDIGYAW